MTELTEVPYLSAKQVTQLKKNNINTVVDLLYSFPSRFEDYTIVTYDDILDVTKVVTIAGIIQSKATVMNLKTSLTMMNFYADVDGNVIKVTIFNRQFLKTKIHYGKYVRLTGKFDANKKRFTASERSKFCRGYAFRNLHTLQRLGVSKRQRFDLFDR